MRSQRRSTNFPRRLYTNSHICRCEKAQLKNVRQWRGQGGQRERERRERRGESEAANRKAKKITPCSLPSLRPSRPPFLRLAHSLCPHACSCPALGPAVVSSQFVCSKFKHRAGGKFAKEESSFFLFSSLLSISLSIHLSV